MLPVIEYLHRLAEVIRDYCKEDLTEDVVRNNFVVIYQVRLSLAAVCILSAVSYSMRRWMAASR